MSRHIFGPFNRVEGDLEVRLDIASGEVKDARVVSPMYRGFEQILHGKDPRDALVYVPRICGICSVSQSMAAASALADAQGIAAPPNGELAANLILATENVADHLTHFYLFFMPDFAREIYRGEDWHPDVEARFKAVQGTASRDVLPARAEFMHILGILAGKWPHTLSIQPGGSTKSVQIQERARLTALIAGFRRFLETVLFGDKLEAVSTLTSVSDLENRFIEDNRQSADLGQFSLRREKAPIKPARLCFGTLFVLWCLSNGGRSRVCPWCIPGRPGHGSRSKAHKRGPQPFLDGPRQSRTTSIRWRHDT